MDRLDWVRGDVLGLDIPAHAAALVQGGPAFLTRAFRAAGVLAPDNCVSRIVESRELAGGSTGRKLLLTVEYAQPAPGLRGELFVKFSRDFEDARRDAARTQMEREVRFALLSLRPEFPITVPACCFADYHQASGTGILVTQRIGFGSGGIEPQYAKAMDYAMPDPLEHYQALIRALARLAGTHQAGRLPAGVERDFPFEPEVLSVARRAPYTPAQISERVGRYSAFAQACPRLVPEPLRSDGFLARLAHEAPRLQALEVAGHRMLQSAPQLIALCHWNAHVDNAWFWRDAGGALQCGLMDWGNVSLMNLAMPLWGCLSAAELEIWSAHLDGLLALFVDEYTACGGPALHLDELKLHLAVYAGLMGLAWLLDCPGYLLSQVPDLHEVANRLDPRIERSERARAQLLLMLNFLGLWHSQDMERAIARIESFAA